MIKKYQLLLVLLAFFSTAQSQVPSKVSYQGLLTTPAGQPVADGNYDLQFDLFNAAALGTLRHSETHTGVEVLRGTFNVILGSSSPLPAIFSEQLFVEITVQAGPGIGSAITFAPRTELTSAPYSLAPWVPSGSNVSFPTGNVGIGTTSPIQKLDISGGGNIYLDGSNAPRWGVFWKGTVDPYQVGIYSGGGSVATNKLHFFTNGIDNVRLAISEIGDIGIGTTTPTQKLDVAGTIQATGFRMSTGAANGYVLTSDATGLASWQPAPSLGGNINGSGTTNFLSKFTGTNTIGNSVVFESGGNVGIGTTSPDGVLALRSDASVNPPTIGDSRAYAQDVGGLLSFIGKSDAAGNLSTFAWIKGGKENSTSGDYAGYFGILTRPNGGGSFIERMRVTSAGNVGMGTTAPNYNLHVGANTLGRSAITAEATSENAYMNLRRSGDAATIVNKNDGTLRINHSGSSDDAHVVISTSGNVGVGMTTPSQKLDVAGTVKMTGFHLGTAPSTGYVLTSDASGVGTWQPASGGGSQWTTSGSNIYYNSGNVGLGITTPARNLHISRNDFSAAQGIVIENLGTDNDFTGSIIELNNPNVSAGATSGNFRIGRNTFGMGVPGGSIGMSTNHPFSIFTNGSHRFFVASSGNIGVGTTSPADKLTIIDNANVQQSLRSTGGTAAATFRINNNADQPLDLLSFGSTYAGTRIAGISNAGLNELSSQGSNGLLIRNWSNIPIYFATNSLERMRIDGSGNVGIGTASPTERLEVVGNIKVGAATIRNGTGSPEGVVSGNVGDLFLRTDGGPGSTMYVKESNSGGSTGWAAK